MPVPSVLGFGDSQDGIGTSASLPVLHLSSTSAALGHQDLPEKEELGDIQLPAVLLPLRHAGPALREPV